MVGHAPLEGGIMVRVHVPQPVSLFIFKNRIPTFFWLKFKFFALQNKVRADFF